MASNPSFLHSHYLKGKVLAALLALAPLLALALLAVAACTPDEAAEPLVPPAAPVATASAQDRQVTVTWNSGPEVAGYTIYWSTTYWTTKSGAGPTGTALKEVTSPFVHTGLPNWRDYHYVLTAANWGGTSTPSPEVSATPSPKVANLVFPDANLELCIRATSVTHAADITFLACPFHGIADLSGIEELRGLTTLRLEANAISDLSPLAGLTALATLRLDNNRIADVNALASLTGLTDLGLSGNSIVDVSALAGLAALNRLELDENRVPDVNPLATLAALKTLGLSNNRIGDVSPLASLTGLKVLNLSDNPITFGVAPLILLKQAATISLAGTGNIAILCAELDTLEMGLGAGVVSRPTGCL